MEQERPDRQAVVGQVDLFPVRAMVVAAIRTGLRAGIDDLGVQRMHGEGAHRGGFGQAEMQCLPTVTTVGHAIEAGLHHPAAPGFTGQPQVDV